MEILLGVCVAALVYLGLVINKYKKENVALKLVMIEQFHNKNTISDGEDKENFLKFVSDSREWAFDYIEDVQEKITIFINDVEPEIAYFDEYGVVGDAYPHYHSMKKISQAYKELKKLLPEDPNA